MGVYVKTTDNANYYYPKCLQGVDSVTDRADEIAVGSNGGGRGYISGSGVEDTPMLLSVSWKELMKVSQGFAFLLGSFSGVWQGAGKVKLRLAENGSSVFFKEFLTDKALSGYDYKIELAVVDNGGHIVAKELELGTSVYDSSIGKYKHTFELPSGNLDFGTDTDATPLTDLSKVSVYLRGYFRDGGERHIEYIGGSIELDSNGGIVPFHLRGFVDSEWLITGNEFSSLDINQGELLSNVEYMPKSEKITATFPSYSDSSVALRSEFLFVFRLESAIVTDIIPVVQKSSIPGSLEFSMRAIRSKSKAARSFKFKIFASGNHSWAIYDKPSWVTVSSYSDSGSATITISFASNDTFEARGGNLIILDTTASQSYRIPCVQWGIEQFYAVENIVPGEVKTIKAYAASIVKNAFDMEVAYYNAASFNLYLRQIGFNIKDFAAGTNGLATLNMKSGACGGRDFNITDCEYVSAQDRWKLTLDRLEDSSVGMVFPNIAFPIREGDRFVLTDILMPEVYILVAERKLLAKARVYYDRNSKLRYLYDLEIDSKWIKTEGVYLHPGMYMQIADTDLIGVTPAYVLIDTVTVTHGDSNIPVFKVTLREKLYLPE